MILTTLLLCLACLPAACGGGDDAEKWAATLEEKDAQIVELREIIAQQQQKVEDLREIIRKKQEEVSLHRELPDVTDRRLAGIEREKEELQQKLEDLKLQYETLLRRYDSQQRRLMECQERKNPAP